MNEPRKAGRPRKHLADEHHFKSVTSVDDSAAGAPPADSETDQVGVSTSSIETDTPAAPIVSVDSFDIVADDTAEAVVENPIVSAELLLENTALHTTGTISESLPEDAENVLSDSFLNGWNTLDTEIVLQQPPRNGMPVFLSSKPDGEGTLAFWKRTRAFNGKRYDKTGKWVDFQTGMSLVFQPRYWKARF